MPITHKASEKTRGALGICAKARRLITGTAMICEAMRSERTRPLLVLAASDNSDNTAKRLSDRCAYYGVELITLDLDRDALSRVLGKSGNVAAVAVTDENLCRLVRNTLIQN
jgi:ribosomal protein L7Ae-like RNA K-turn-binding protein